MENHVHLYMIWYIKSIQKECSVLNPTDMVQSKIEEGEEDTLHFLTLFDS